MTLGQIVHLRIYFNAKDRAKIGVASAAAGSCTSKCETEKARDWGRDGEVPVERRAGQALLKPHGPPLASLATPAAPSGRSEPDCG